jgi:pimeloyl-ACP methyl ester carboxylesterase
VLVDPVPSLVNDAGTGVTNDVNTLAMPGKTVIGAAADGAARVVLQIFAASVGDTLTLSVQPSPGDTQSPVNGLTQPLGQLQTILAADGSQSGSQIALTAVSTSQGPMAFAQYFPPKDFSRGGSDDSAASRSVVIQATSTGVGGSCQQTLTIVRPPLVEVHGLWTDSHVWGVFEPQLPQGLGLWVYRVNYSYSLNGAISASIPSYGSFYLNRSTTSALGFEFNVPVVNDQIRNKIAAFKSWNQVAVVQADVIGHSMGGNVMRANNNNSLAVDWSTFQSGAVNKLMTIGTPHLGTPLASALINDPASCVRNALAFAKNLSFQTVTIGGISQSGAVGDLEGDGLNAYNASMAIFNYQTTNNGHPVPTAMIAAQMDPAVNGSGLSVGAFARNAVGTFCGLAEDPLAQYFTAQGWTTMLGGLPNDGLVPVNSELNGLSGEPVVMDTVHSEGLLKIGFNGPDELQSGQVVTDVIQLLNAPSGSTCSAGSCASPFYTLP